MATLRVASSFQGSVTALDPARINVLEEHVLIENLYGQLVEYGDDQGLVSDIAESFFWENENLVFTFSSLNKTVEGHAIKAEDAYYSLKRAIYLKKTGHGDLRELLCPGYELKSMEDDCPGISLKDKRLVLTPASPNYAPFLLPYLASADFSIIPKSALDLSHPEVPISSYKNTSGPYYVEHDSKDGEWLLSANPGNSKYSPNMPQQIRLIPSARNDPMAALLSGTVDLVPTFLSLDWRKHSSEYEDGLADINQYESMPIKVLLVCFTPDAVKKFSAEQRFFAARIIAKEMKSRVASTKSTDTIEFFQGLSDGSLSDSEIQVIKELRKSKEIPVFNSPIQFSSGAISYDLNKKVFSRYPEIDVVNKGVSAFLLPLRQRPDMYVIFNDSAWSENLALLSYNISNGFKIPGQDMNQWIKDYIATSDRNKRLEKLRSWHFELLKQAIVYPVIAMPYTAYARKPWKPDFLTFRADTQLWRMRIKQ